jgi:hypothetical protein
VDRRSDPGWGSGGMMRSKSPYICPRRLKPTKPGTNGAPGLQHHPFQAVRVGSGPQAQPAAVWTAPCLRIALCELCGVLRPLPGGSASTREDTLGADVVRGLVALADLSVDRQSPVRGTLTVLIRPTLDVPLGQEPVA